MDTTRTRPSLPIATKWRRWIKRIILHSINFLFLSIADGQKWFTASSACTQKCALIRSLDWTNCRNCRVLIICWRQRSCFPLLCSPSDRAPLSETERWVNCEGSSYPPESLPQNPQRIRIKRKWTTLETLRKPHANICRTRAINSHWMMWLFKLLTRWATAGKILELFNWKYLFSSRSSPPFTSFLVWRAVKHWSLIYEIPCAWPGKWWTTVQLIIWTMI